MKGFSARFFLWVTVWISISSLNLFAQENSEPGVDGIFYKKSKIPPDVVFLPFLSLGYTAYNMDNENKLIKNLSEYSSGSEIRDLTPGASLRGGLGIFLPYANSRIVFEYQQDRLSNTTFKLFGEGTSFYLTHDMNVFLVQFDKLFQFRTKKYSVSNAYAGVGLGVILISDTRKSELDYKYNLGSVGHVSSKLKTESYLAVVNLMAGKFNSTTGSVFMELRAGYQFTISTRIYGEKKPGFDPSDYSPDLNAFRISVLFGIIL